MSMRLERNALFAMLILAAIFPFFVASQYVMHVGTMILFYAVLATSLNLIVGYIGEFSLGHTALLGIGAYTAAIFSARFGFPMWATVPLAGVLSAFFGVFIGAITLRLRGPYFVIITLAVAEVLQILANNWVWLTHGPMGIPNIPQPGFVSNFPGLPSERFYFYIALAIAAVSVYLAYRFIYSSNGRAAVTVRENRFVAQSVGIHPFAYAMRAFVLGAFLAGLAGGFYAHYTTYVGPNVFGFSFMISMIIMVLIGGKGTLVGPLIGALLVTLLNTFLRDFQEIRLSLFGLIVIAIVFFLPSGLLGFLNRRWESSVPVDALSRQACTPPREARHE